MPKNFGQYTGGIQPIQGIENYGNRNADNIANSINSISNALTKGVNDYYTGKVNNESADQQIFNIGASMKSRLEVLSQDPELVSSGVLDGLTEKMNLLKDASKKSYPAKLAIINDAMTYNNGFSDRLREAEFVMGRRVVRDVTSGLAAIPDKEPTASPLAIESGQVPWDINLNAVQNRTKLEKFVRDAEANGGVIDRRAMYKNWHRVKEAEINESKQMTPDQKARALDGLAASNAEQERRFESGAEEFYRFTDVFDPDTWEGGYDAVVKTPTGQTVKPSAVAKTPAPVAPAKVSAPVAVIPEAVKAAATPAAVIPATVVPTPAPAAVVPAPAAVVPATVEPRPAPAVVTPVAPVAPAPAPAVVAPAKVEAPAPVATAPAPATGEEEFKLMGNGEARALDISPQEFAEAVKKSGLTKDEFFGRLRREADDKGLDIRDVFKAQQANPPAKAEAPVATTPDAIKAAGTPADVGKPVSYEKPPETGGSYNVRKNENLFSISQRTGVSIKRIAKANGFNLNHPNFKGGETIVIPPTRAANEAVDRDPDSLEPLTQTANITRSEAEGSTPSDDASTESTSEPAPAGLPPPAPAKPDPKANMEKIREMAVKEDTRLRYTKADRLSTANAKAAEYAQRVLDDITSPESIASGYAPSVDANAWTKWKRANPAAGGTMEFTATAAQYVTAVGGVVKVLKGVQGVKAMASAQGFASLVSKGYKPLLDKAAKAYNGNIPQAVKDKILKTATLGAKEEILAAKSAARASGMKLSAGMLLADQFVGTIMGTDDWEHPPSTYVYDEANIENDMVTMVDTLGGIRNYGVGIDPDKITPLQRTKMAEYLNTKIADFQSKSETARQEAKNVFAQPARTYDQIIGRTPDGEIDPKNAVSGFEGQTLTPKTGRSGMIGMGYLSEERAVTAEEKKKRLQAYMMGKYKDSSGAGYIPSGFDAAYKALVPESSLKIVQTAIGPMFNDGTHWKQVEMPKQQSIQDIRKESIGLFGKRTADGSLAPVELGEGTGVHLAGLFSGGDEALAKYKEQISELSSGRGAIKALDKILAQFGHSLSPTLIGEAKIHLATLRAATRIEVIGVGTVSEMEQKMLNDANPDTTSIFRFDAVDRAKLRVLKEKLERKMKLISGVNNIGIKIVDRDDDNIERDLRLSK